MKSSNNQIHIHIHIHKITYTYAYIYTYVSPQESYTGRTAKTNMYVTRKEKIYMHNSRKTSYPCTKPKNESYYTIFQRIFGVLLFIPIHYIFLEVFDKIFFPLITSESLFVFYESQPVSLAEVIDASEASLGGPGGRPSQMSKNRVK